MVVCEVPVGAIGVVEIDPPPPPVSPPKIIGAGVVVEVYIDIVVAYPRRAEGKRDRGILLQCPVHPGWQELMRCPQPWLVWGVVLHCGCARDGKA